MSPSHLNFPLIPTCTGVCVSTVVSCIFCTATRMIMCSSLQDGQSPLMFASQNGHIEIVRILLSASAKVDLQNEVTYSMALW